VENKHNSENQKINQSLTVHLDDSIIEFLKQREVDISHLKINPQESSQLIFLKKKDRLWIQFPDGQFCDFAFYLKNIIYFLSHYGLQAGPVKTPEDTFLNFNRSVETFQKKIYSSVSLNPNDNFKDLWDEIIKKTNLISNESHSLRSLVEKILEVPFLQKFESSIIYFHLKGQTKAEMIGTRWRSENVNNFMEVKDFNIFFNSIKKSKIKTFNSEDFQKPQKS
jgi:hypothetical protein